MKRRASTPGQIIGKLREAEVILSQGQTVKDHEDLWETASNAVVINLTAQSAK